jgi:phospholipid/cholesterol/gamma-HCH transport system ATP-binding protein
MIELSGVNKSFDRAVLCDVTLRVPASCLYGLIGPGASGKSLLLKTITGLVRPDSGSVRVDGHDVLALTDTELHEFRKGIGMLFQNNALFDFMTVADNIAFPLRRLFQLSDSEVEARVAERLACVNLPGFEARLPAQPSRARRSCCTTSQPLASTRSLVRKFSSYYAPNSDLQTPR